ncbi:hypothetical protein [Mycobacteroides abscessus]|uniref:Uncharacterized protein n=2 Tax=Mycobacteroides abscessus TaxID=36809 RepID=X8DNG9_9MYCO|nr:hypothetical protein [Mycobacteroides abscessus]EUA69954.1 hypothetical protein I540_1143 [Mycobacteroides abscessus subsp. bolletii 1513]AMU64913.1 hypothetical protein A3O04_06160 [Mycobacteroides abscessus]AMU74423.1 hypothetical protein A3O06_06930 [Mycobacteroides abscessus]ANO13472.1 hypothetical protein BAB77_06040 [Mycobacteroides abscessus]ANO23359.1 hypothetical protein BAB79_06925 [Mycobacteroides abscessus]
MIASARDQLEGLGFLYSYLQRVFVFTRTMQMLDPQHPVDVNADELKAALDLVGDTVRQFDFESGLGVARRAALSPVIAVVRGWVDGNRPRPNDSRAQAIAHAASTAYFDEHLNSARIHLGDHYDADYADYCRQRVLLLQAWVRQVSSIVGKTADGVPLTSDEESALGRAVHAMAADDAESVVRNFATVQAVLA